MPLSQGGSGGAGGLTAVFSSVLGAPAASIDTGAGGFTTAANILYVYIYARTTQAAGLSSVLLRFNNDSSANYDQQVVQGHIASASSAQTGGATSVALDTLGSTASANFMSSHVVTIPAYGTTAAFKAPTVIENCSDVTGSNTFAAIFATTYKSTSAINRVSIAAGSGNLVTGSALYVYAA